VISHPEAPDGSRPVPFRAAASAPAATEPAIGERRPSPGRRGLGSALRRMIARRAAARQTDSRAARGGRLAVAVCGLAAIFATLLFLSRPLPDEGKPGQLADAYSGLQDRLFPARSASAVGAAGSWARAAGGAPASHPPVADPPSTGALSLAGGPEATASATGPATELVARLQAAQLTTPRGISGVVRLAPQFASRISPGDILFIYAREPGGNGAPVAFIRKRARHLPLAFFLDDSTSINPARPLSRHDRLVIGARVSRKGDAAASAGDLQGSLEAHYGAAGVVIVIDSEVR